MKTIDYSNFKGIEENRTLLNHVIELGINILHRQTHRSNIIDHEASLLLQMNLGRALSIRDLAPGSNLHSVSLNIKVPFSTAAILRALFESYCTHNNIFIQNSSADEKNLKYNVWVLSGLNFRQNFFESILREKNINGSEKLKEEAKAKKTEESKIIQSLTISIFNNRIVTGMAKDELKSFKKLIKAKKWQIAIKNNSVRYIGWSAMWMNSSAKFQPAMCHFYDHLSLRTHPSNVSVFQFASMYNDGTVENIIEEDVKWTTILLTLFIYDYLGKDSELWTIFESANETSKNICKTYWEMFK